MGNLSTVEMLSTIVILIVVYGVFSGIKNRGVVHLALNNFKVDPEAEDQIIIEGRKTGLWQWILVQLKLGNIYRIKVRNDYVSYSENSARGEILTLVPVKRISSTTCGYQKPLGALIFAVVCVFLAILFLLFSFSDGDMFGFTIIFLVLGAGFGFWYKYSKNFVITIESVGSQRFGFSFKRSFIENVPIEIDRIVDAIELINNLVVHSDKKD